MMPVISSRHLATAAFTLAAVALFGLCGGAWALSLGISPINLFVIAPDKTGAMSLSNQTKVPARLQIRVFRWTQKDGVEVLAPTRDVIANPPSMEIPPDQTYTVRVARISRVPLGAEESYRLILDELPSPIDPTAPVEGVRMLLRTSLPVFFSSKAVTPKIAWRVWNADGKLNIEAVNSGTRHIKLVDLAVEGPQGRTTFNSAGSNAYVLPGSTLRYASMTGATSYPVGTMVTITTAKGIPFEVKQQVAITGGP